MDDNFFPEGPPPNIEDTSLTGATEPTDQSINTITHPAEKANTATKEALQPHTMSHEQSYALGRVLDRVLGKKIQHLQELVAKAKASPASHGNEMAQVAIDALERNITELQEFILRLQKERTTINPPLGSLTPDFSFEPSLPSLNEPLPASAYDAVTIEDSQQFPISQLKEALMQKLRTPTSVLPFAKLIDSSQPGIGTAADAIQRAVQEFLPKLMSAQKLIFRKVKSQQGEEWHADIEDTQMQNPNKQT